MKRIRCFVIALLLISIINISDNRVVIAVSKNTVNVENTVRISLSNVGAMISDVGNFRGNTNYSKSNKSSKDSEGSSSSSGGIGFIFDIVYIILRLLGIKGLFVLAIIGLPFYFFIWPRIRKNSVGIVNQRRVEISNDYPTDNSSFEKLYSKDSQFSITNLIKRVSRIYIEMQQCWMRKDIEPLRAYMEPEFYSHLENQLEQLKSEGLTNYMKNMSVMEVRELKYYEDNDKQCIDMLVRTRCIDYVVDNQGKVVTGSEKDEVFMTYIYTLVRDIDAVTVETELDKSGTEQHICPSCGAPIDIYRSAKCEYCGRILEFKNYEWIINNIEAVQQDS